MIRPFSSGPGTSVTIPEKDRDPLSRRETQGRMARHSRVDDGSGRAWIEAATREYLESEDTLLAWIEDCCELGKNKYAAAGELFASWKAWTERNNEFTGTAKAFGQKLKDHGFEGSHTRGGAVHSGIHLIEPESESRPEHW
jgi:Poxvirus D5 protein-like